TKIDKGDIPPPKYDYEQPNFRSSAADRQRFRESYSRYDEVKAEIQDFITRHPEIPEEDLVALRAYTKHGIYGKINTAMRDGDQAALAEYQPYIRSITSGLEKFPQFEGPVVRGVHVSPEDMQALLERYEPGTTIRESGFTSSSANHSF